MKLKGDPICYDPLCELHNQHKSATKGVKLNMETSEQPTLHDYFAAAALQGICANPGASLLHFDALAQMAFEAADEMLERRQKIRETRRHMQRMITHANNTEAK